jgi:hypothetical protein
MKYPTTEDFDIQSDEAGVTVIFKPTESEYRFFLLAEGGGVSLANVRHAKTGDTDDYPSSEVQEQAFRLASEHAKRPKD